MNGTNSSDNSGKSSEVMDSSFLSDSFNNGSAQVEVSNESYGGVIPATWGSLFSFTSRQHTLTLTLALVLTVIGGLIKPAVAIFIGKYFEDLASYGASNCDSFELMSRISWWCIGLTILGSISWVVNGSFLSFWMVFGELQARSARQHLFSSMLEKAMEWYDLREDGIGSLLIRIQT